MGLTRTEFEILSYLESNGNIQSERKLSNEIMISLPIVINEIENLQDRKLITQNRDSIIINENGLLELEPFRAKKAIIVAAGIGSRMMPATQDKPKPMVTVNGKRIVDTLIDALTSVDICDITVVGGYKIAKLMELQEKYPFIRIINNTYYETENNISSAILAKDYFNSGCYFCEADLYISNPGIIKKYQYSTNILASWSIKTDDWCFDNVKGFAENYRKGGTFCYNYYGISYWTDEDSRKLQKDWEDLYISSDGRQLFWEFPALIQRKEKYRIEIRPCLKSDVIEIDNYYELMQLDSRYKET